jgi:hypothetical protein
VRGGGSGGDGADRAWQALHLWARQPLLLKCRPPLPERAPTAPHSHHPSPPLPFLGRLSSLSLPTCSLVFKLQSNMDPRHRDKVAFVRVVSGK